jgi:hypothetical protein
MHHLTVRLPDTDVARLNRLTDVRARRCGTHNRSAVLREVLRIGMDVIEREIAKEKPPAITGGKTTT